MTWSRRSATSGSRRPSACAGPSRNRAPLARRSTPWCGRGACRRPRSRSGGHELVLPGAPDARLGAAAARMLQKPGGAKGYSPGSTARVQPRITHERPVVDALDGRGRGRGRRQCPPFARREPDELLRALAIRPGRLDLGTTGPALATLRLPRALGVLLGFALVFLAAAVAAIHARPFLSHRTPFSLTTLYMTGYMTGQWSTVAL